MASQSSWVKSFADRLETPALDMLEIDRSYNAEQRTVENVHYSLVKPTPMKNPKTGIVSQRVLDKLGISKNEAFTEEFANLFSGTKLPDSITPYSHNYCGHQFAHYSGQLGDGAAMAFGDIKTDDGILEVQVKGAGKTPYSRTADGRKVLRSTVREFLTSEAFFALGIPTTRAAAVLYSDDMVIRDIEYNGNIINEMFVGFRLNPRLYPHFMTPNADVFDTVKRDMELTGVYHLAEDWPRLIGAVESAKLGHLAWLGEIVKRNARLVSKWHSLGFSHGMMNTDNICIDGATIDYGPFAFVDYYDPHFVASLSDREARYSFISQKMNMKWNLRKFAEIVAPAISVDQHVLCDYTDALFDSEFTTSVTELLRNKLGFTGDQIESTEKHISEHDLMERIFDSLRETHCDFTNAFKELEKTAAITGDSAKDSENSHGVAHALGRLGASKEILMNNYKPKFSEEQVDQITLVSQLQPGFIEQAGLSGLLTMHNHNMYIRTIASALPDDPTELAEFYSATWLPVIEEYQKDLTSKIITTFDKMGTGTQDRTELMTQTNPWTIPRTWVLDVATRAAEKGNWGKVEEVFAALMKPNETSEYSHPPSKQTPKVCLSCSS